MNDSTTLDERAATGSDSGWVWIAGILAVAASFPALFAHGLMGDDWVVHYTYWTEGLTGVTRMLWEGGHGGYFVPMDLYAALGRDTPNVVARIAGLGFHVLNGMLLYRVLRIPPQTRPIAALAAALFYLSPFYAIRLTLNAVYDFFLVFYLLSYLLMQSPSRWLRWLAPPVLLFSLSLETLLALEPLRLLLVYGTSERWRERIMRWLPFAATIVIFMVLRFTVMGRSGHYAGQYSAVHDFGVMKLAFVTHLRALVAAISYARAEGFEFLGRNASKIVVGATAVPFAVLGRPIRNIDTSQIPARAQRTQSQ